MKITLENGLTVALMYPEKAFYRAYSISGNYKDFMGLEDAEKLLEYDFFNQYTLYKVVEKLDESGKATNTTFIKIN